MGPASLPHMNVRAKFKCESVTAYEGAEDGSSCNVEITLRAVISGPENEQWSRWTPNGVLTMTITNPAAAKAFFPGSEHFLDFSPA